MARSRCVVCGACVCSMPQCNRDAESRDVCSQARVTDTPMWVIGGTALAGYQEPTSLIMVRNGITMISDLNQTGRT